MREVLPHFKEAVKWYFNRNVTSHEFSANVLELMEFPTAYVNNTLQKPIEFGTFANSFRLRVDGFKFKKEEKQYLKLIVARYFGKESLDNIPNPKAEKKPVVEKYRTPITSPRRLAKLARKQKRKQKLEAKRLAALDKKRKTQLQKVKPKYYSSEVAIAPKKDKLTPKQNHANYLDSDHWINFRQSYYKQNEKRCFHCRTYTNIKLHHKHYRTTWKETFEDVVPLCKGCHTLTHQLIKSKLTSKYSCTSENAHEFLDKITPEDKPIIQAIVL